MLFANAISLAFLNLNLIYILILLDFHKITNMKFQLSLAIVFFVLVSCDNITTEEQKAEEDFKENMKEAKEDLGGAFKNVGEALTNLKKKHNIEDKEPINFRDMKALMPASLGGMEQSDNSGQTSGILGMKISTAKAIYEEGNAKLEIKITDIAGVRKLASKLADWTNLDIDKESKDGYERTTTIDGYKAYEKYDARRQKGKIAMIIDERLIVDIEGRNITEDQLKDALEDISIRKLKRLIK